jgi:hypothetical protein
MTAERDRLRSQRDGFSKQFEELSKLRTTDMESVFDKYKEKTALQAKSESASRLDSYSYSCCEPDPILSFRDDLGPCFERNDSCQGPTLTRCQPRPTSSRTCPL